MRMSEKCRNNNNKHNNNKADNPLNSRRTDGGKKSRTDTFLNEEGKRKQKSTTILINTLWRQKLSMTLG